MAPGGAALVGLRPEQGPIRPPHPSAPRTRRDRSTHHGHHVPRFRQPAAGSGSKSHFPCCVGGGLEHLMDCSDGSPILAVLPAQKGYSSSWSSDGSRRFRTVSEHFDDIVMTSDTTCPAHRLFSV